MPDSSFATRSLAVLLLAFTAGTVSATPNVEIVHAGGLCLSSDPAIPFIPCPAVYLADCADVALRYQPPPRGFTGPIRIADGRCLEIPDAQAIGGAHAVPRDCDGSSRQDWTLMPDGKIVNAGSGQCLAPLDPVTGPGSPAGVAPCDDSAEQRWRARSYGRFQALGLGDGAAVTAVATAPTVGHLWIGTPTGVFRSVDDGATFFPARADLPARWVDRLVASPDAPDTAWAQVWADLFRTVDGGRSWQRLRDDVQLVGRHPADGRLWAWTTEPNGAWRSADGGATWTPITDPRGPDREATRLVDVVFAPDDPDRAWVAGVRDFTESKMGVWRTSDGGASWTHAVDDVPIRQLVIDQDEPTTLYASSHFTGTLLRSLDSGATWAPLAGPPDDPTVLTGALAVDGTTLVSGLRSGAIWRLDPEQETWTRVLEASEPLSSIHGLESDPRIPGRLYALGSLADSLRRGLLRSDDSGRSWTLLDRGLRAASIDRVAADPSQPNRLFAPVSGSVYRSLDGGRTWAYATGFGAAPVSGTWSAPLAVRPSAEAGGPPTVFAGRPYLDSIYGKQDFRRSDDGGETWIDLAVPGEDVDIRAIAVDPDDPSRVFAVGEGRFSGFAGGIYLTTDDRFWTRVGPEDRFDDLAILPGGRLFASGLGDLYRSSDGGTTWEIVDDDGTPVSAALWNGRVHLARSAGLAGIELSDDAGDTWTARPVPTCAVGARPSLHPTTPGVLYLAQRGPTVRGACVGSTVWISRDGGARWTRIGGLSMRAVRDLQVLPGDGRDHLLAATEGSGFAEALIDDDSLPVVLRRDRFSVSVRWTDAASRRGTARPVDLAGDSGLFWFFGPENLEILVKVLDGREINGHFWVFWGAATDLGLEITVTDHATGAVHAYTNPVGSFASGGDPTAFADAAMPGLGDDKLGPTGHGFREVGTTLPLGADDRFRARVTWRAADGAGDARAFELTEDTGGFWFFEASNVELLVKVLDAREINGRFWVFWGSTSNVAFTLCVEDTSIGVERCWENPDGTFASGADTEAFGD